MPKIRVTAVFEVFYVKTVTKDQLKRLEAGTSINEIVDETEPYTALRTRGDCEMDWELVAPKKRQPVAKKKATR